MERTSDASPAEVEALKKPKRASSTAPLTARQLEVLQYIERFSREHEFPPSGREVAEACGLGSPSGAHRMICTLEHKGYLTRSPGRSRGLSLITNEFDGSSLSPRESELLATVCIEPHRRIRDAELAMAASISDRAIRTWLIEDAAARNERLISLDTEERLRLDAAIVRRKFSNFPDSVQILQLPVAAVRHRWADFVVSSFVTNRVQTKLSRELDQFREFRNVCFWRDIEICTTAGDQAEIWLDEILASDDFDRQPLGVRVRELCRRTMNASATFEYTVGLPPGFVADLTREVFRAEQFVELCGSDFLA